MELLQSTDLDIDIDLPAELRRIASQDLVNLTPWHLMPRELAARRIRALRQRYSRKYVPIAYRQDNDDIACIDPAQLGKIVIVHDFASEGAELRRTYGSFWEWFRAAIDQMIEFE